MSILFCSIAPRVYDSFTEHDQPMQQVLGFACFCMKRGCQWM